MSYQLISIREAVEKINAQNDCWVLPAVQRPYVWGSRNESEKYICKLFDSILKGYPIGTLIIWNTSEEIPYHEFLQHYKDGELAPQVDKNLWKRNDKNLVYDGQQRLQTLYSCLRYTINERILVYDLLYDEKEEGNFGFLFKNKNEKLLPGQVAMNILFAQKASDKVTFRKDIKKDIEELSEEDDKRFEQRFDDLWTYFVKTDSQAIAYFPVGNDCSEDQVNDIFERINTGGVPLSGADLLFTKIKEKYTDFEERLYHLSQDIYVFTNGYDFSQNEILQLVNLLVKGQIRIDAQKTKTDEIDKFEEVSRKIEEPLKDFFNEFLYTSFGINNESLISVKRALLPIMVYIYKNNINGTKYSNISMSNLKKMKKYLIVSQINGWDTQGIVEGASKLVNENSDFPYDKIEKLAVSKKRISNITIESLENNIWFVLKILTPSRIYVLDHRASKGRYKPELDHIFPLKLEGRPSDYDVNVIWNLQPVSGKTNLDKSNTHPKIYFSNEDAKNHISEYDFVPNIDSCDWDDHKLFIKNRKDNMVQFLKDNYDVVAI